MLRAGWAWASPESVHSWLLKWIPGWSRPLVRLALALLTIAAGDAITGFFIDNGWTMPVSAVTALRIVTALPILRFPFASFLVALEIDKWDWYWLDAGHRGAEFESFYNGWDKALDLVVLATAAIVALRWPDRRMRALALGAFAWRTLGVIAYLATERGWLLVAFPNAFQTLFLMYLVYYLLAGHPTMLRSGWVALAALLAALLPKVGEEYFIHVLHNRPWNYVVLPTPDAIEPFLWAAATYLPAVLMVAVLVRTQSGPGAGGDREKQLGVA